MNCGIDFGTSNSAIAITGADGAGLARVEGDAATLPSAMFYPAGPGGAPLFGRCAMRAFTEGDEGRFMRSLKRILGTSLAGQGTLVNGRLRKFEDILADFIGHMKNRAEAQCGMSVGNVVMGRPVHFVDNDPAADRRAQDELGRIAKSVGFKGVEFQYEPIAAAFAHERRLTGETMALVVDIGGGTSDFTVIRLSGNHKDKADRRDDILANGGIRVGGNDFDKELCLAVFMPPLGYGTTYGDKNMILPAAPFHEMSEWSKINFFYTPKSRVEIRDLYNKSHDKVKFGRFAHIVERETGHRLLAVVENSKIDLTESTAAQASLAFIEKGLALKVPRKTFDQAIGRHIAAISRSITECLRQASLGADKIELVVLTGGTTEVPLLRNTIQSRFPAAALSEENKLSSVALGLGYDAIRRFGTG